MFYALAGLALGNALLLGRIESMITIPIWGDRLSLLSWGLLAILPIWLVGGTSESSYARYFVGYVAVVTCLGISGFLFHGVYHDRAFISLFYHCVPVLAAVYASELHPRYAEKLHGVIVNIISVVAAIGAITAINTSAIASVVGWDHHVSRAVSPLGGPIATGAVILLCWPYVLYTALTRPSFVLVARCAVVLLALLTTGSRLIFLAAIVASLVVVGMSLRSLARRVIATRTAMLLLFAAIAGGVYGSVADLKAVDRLSQSLGAMEGDRLRNESFYTGIHLIGKSPIVGLAPGHTYPWRSRVAANSRSAVFMVDGRQSLVEPHNTFVMLGVEFGVLGAAAFAALSIAALRRLYGSADQKLRVVAQLSAAAVLAFLLQALGSSHLLINMRVATIFWLFLGCGVAMARTYYHKPVVVYPS